MCFDVFSHQGWLRAKGIKIEESSVTAGSMTALPTEDFWRGRGFEANPTNRVQYQWGQRSDPRISGKKKKVAQWHRCQKLLTDQTGKLLFKASSIYKSCKPHTDWRMQAGITMDSDFLQISSRGSVSPQITIGDNAFEYCLCQPNPV